MPKISSTQKRSTKYCNKQKMWALITTDSKGQKCLQDQYMPTKKQAEAWVQKKLGEGNCYEIASKLLFNPITKKDFKLCHGTVVGQGSIENAIFGHAWLEYQESIPTVNGNKVTLEMVLDHSNHKKTEMPKALYYKIGKISNIVKYSKKEARDKLLTHLTYGPWN